LGRTPSSAIAGLITVQRDKTATSAATGAAEIAALDDQAIRNTTDAERLRMIDVLNEQGSASQRVRLARLWDWLTDEKAVADSNVARWKKSFEVAPTVMRDSHNVQGARAMFYRDVVHVANDYLEMNEHYCKEEFQRLGLSETGDVVAGPPTADQAAELQRMREDATKLAADQEALADLRKIKVGYGSAASAPGGTGAPEYVGKPVEFDPDRPPGSMPAALDASMHRWEDVKKQHDALESLIRARLMVNPTLYAMAQGAQNDPGKAKTVSAGPQSDALKTLGDGLKEVLVNIDKTRPLLSTLAKDLEPIHGQLMSGVRVPAAERNWARSPFYAAIAADMVEERKPGPWWKELGLAAVEMGAYAVAGLATGGTAFAVALAAKGVMNTALAQGRSQALQAAYGASTTEESQLITEGQIDAAKAEVIETAAFALLDVAMAGGALRGALREVLQYEKVAAESALKASAEADKLIVKEMAKDAKDSAAAAKAVLPEVRADADKAAQAAVDAKARAASATTDETARATVAVERTELAATRAKNAAEDVAAAAEGKYNARAKAVTDPSGLGSKASYEATVRAAKREIGGTWAALSPMERQAKVLKIVEDRMAAQGIPGFASVRLTPGSGGAAAAWWSWELHLDPALLNGAHQLESIVGLIYHEAAHFEDFINVVRYQLGRGVPPSEVQALLNMNERGMRAAIARGALTSANAEFSRAKAIFESVWGASKGARDAIYKAKTIAKLDYELERLRFGSLFDAATGKLRPGRTAAEVTAGENILKEKLDEYVRRIAAYEALPEEVQAYGVQAGLHQSFERSALRQEILKVAAVLVAAGLAAGGMYQLADKLK
jgi:hypothetical protein